MKMTSRLFAASLLFIFIACKQTGDQKPQLAKDISIENLKNKSEEFTSPTDSAGPLQNDEKKQASPPSGTVTKEDWDKKIIRTADISLEIKNYKVFDILFRSTTKALGGYIAQEEQNQSEYKIENLVTIKIPVDVFDDAVSKLVSTDGKILKKEISSEDVTAELVDTKSRMESRKKVRERYLDLLKQAKNMEEILQVQNEINGIQEQVEAAGGRIKYLSHAAAYSTIHLNFYEVLNVSAGNIAEPGFGARIAASFKSGLHGFGELLVLLVTFWPLWLFVITGWFLIRKYRSFMVKKA
jgi:Domain of unknown function (DUF4349)